MRDNGTISYLKQCGNRATIGGGFIDSPLITRAESQEVGMCPELEQGWRGAGCFD